MKHIVVRVLVATAACTFALALALAGPFARAQNPPAPPASPKPPFLKGKSSDVQQGYALYTSKGCYLCHGHVGQGTPMAGPALLPGAPYEYLLHFVRVPMYAMPPYFPDVLSDDNVRLIALYLQAIPPSQKAEDIPLLRTP